ncbi:prostaglandin E2 receptor EP2 subtype-like isoform X1 [Scyliorhinus torazame]|uniref:prostaglandin E2 receptor EP2 subtype-like isoform X1 n=1 Tax=Scyliorhinus torazame TaxID=75743 RepID=UPI003B5A058A
MWYQVWSSPPRLSETCRAVEVGINPVRVCFCRSGTVAMIGKDSLGMENGNCEKSANITVGAEPAVSAAMFATGVVGNVLALVVLAAHRRDSRNKASLFHILVSGLIVCDLLGTVLISPMVLAAYSTGRSLRDLGLCRCCAFAMAFFGLTSMLILLAMALERCLSIGCPYLYRRHASKRCGLLAIPAFCAFSGLFCCLPLLGIGQVAQYCPGTWCFIRMWGRPLSLQHRVYSLSYAVLLKLLIVSTLLCNVSVIVNLCRMYQKQRTRRCSRSVHPGGGGDRRPPPAEEVDHLILLAIVTVTFVACSVPLTVRAYIGAIYEEQSHNHYADLQALRCLSFNPIIDPWVFIILNTSKVKKTLSRILC